MIKLLENLLNRAISASMRSMKIEADPTDRRAGPGRSNWEHVRVCPECRELTSHEEFMTEICLSCGRHMRSLPRRAAVRHIFWQGEWRKQLHDKKTDYIRKDNAWAPWPQDVTRQKSIEESQRADTEQAGK